MFTSRIFVLISTIACVSAIAEGDESLRPAGSGAQGEFARGVVFADSNGNERRDAGEQGIANVRVSNGRDIVQTDDAGRYRISVDADDIVFVIKPRDWMTPVNEQQLPRFYYIHKPAGSPETFKFAGVEPTGPLPDSIDFPLRRREEPDQFKAIMFGDPQPRNIQEVEYNAHDVFERVIAAEAHGAAFGVTLGDIVFDDLSMMGPQNQAIALIGIPWYNVIGNHDLNLEAAADAQSDETFERIYGPAYYSFDYGPTHFLVLDDVMWHGAKDGQKGHYHGGLGEQQMEFIRNDLAAIPEEQLVVLMMHIPLLEVKDRQQLYRLIETRPAAVSISAHRHFMEHRFIGAEDGWRGKEKHHHIINVTVCGSWWRGQKDERGLPHTTMSDGGPNGYSVMEFDGSNYALSFKPAARPDDYQMNIYAPESVPAGEAETVEVLANVFNGSDRSRVEMRVGRSGDWRSMQQITMNDPAFAAMRAREEARGLAVTKPHSTNHIWKASLPAGLRKGTRLIEIRATEESGKSYVDQRMIRVQ
jgi:hypothetical protein